MNYIFFEEVFNHRYEILPIVLSNSDVLQITEIHRMQTHFYAKLQKAIDNFILAVENTFTQNPSKKVKIFTCIMQRSGQHTFSCTQLGGEMGKILMRMSGKLVSYK